MEIEEGTILVTLIEFRSGLYYLELFPLSLLGQ